MNDQPPPPGMLDLILFWLGAFVAWATGEGGRVMIAGGAGGFMRWLMSEKKTLRNGGIQVGAGLLCANYLSPVVLAILSVPMPSLATHPRADVTAGFLAGVIGIGFTKIVIAAVEARGRAIVRDDEDGGSGNA